MTDVARTIVQALRGVYDPCCRERGISVVDMGLLRDIRVEGDDVRIELVLTSGWCPFAVDLVGEITKQIESLPEVGNAEIAVVWDEVWTTERLSDDARRKLRFLPDPGAVDDREGYIAAHTVPSPGKD